MKRARGTNAAGWFYGQSFNGRASRLEKEAERNFEFYASTKTADEIFGPEPKHWHRCRKCDAFFSCRQATVTRTECTTDDLCRVCAR
jgi:hypothetical protein